MELTKEQYDIIHSNGDVKINAVAGSGKTTTLISYAKSRDPKSKILYLALNNTVKTKALQKFAAAGINDIKIETAHSLALENINKHRHFKITPNYKNYDWCDILGINTGDRMTDLIVANHVTKFLSYFCNSRALKIADLNYADTITEPTARLLVTKSYDLIEKYTREALAKMDKSEIAITHDFYLKKFQLSQPLLPYDYVLFDEGQDASAVMLSLFLQQRATKIIVGDINQQIYGCRYANSLQQIDFPEYNLSNSFRFNDEIALLANKILGWKKYLNLPDPLHITGVRNNTDIIETKATIGRTNLGVLLSAISQWKQDKLRTLYFEGNINKYTFIDEGTSLYDVLALSNGRKGIIKDKLIAAMNSLADLKKYIRKTENPGLAMMVDIVKEFGNDLPTLIDELRANQSSVKEDADMIFGTVHRCKWMEYDSVTLLNDFITEKKLKKSIVQSGLDEMTETVKNYITEEINILYVAATRAKNKLIIPPEISPLRSLEFVSQMSVPASVPLEKNILDDNYSARIINNEQGEYKSRQFNKPDNHGNPWTDEEVAKLREMYNTHHPIDEIAKQLQRGETAVRLKLYFTGLIRVQDML